MNIEQIYLRLKELHKNAYCQYSHYPVSAIIKADNKFYEGVNVENGAFPLSVCAERNAIAHAVSQGVKKIDAVYLLAGEKVGVYNTPCGGCRQVIAEFATNENIPIFVFDIKGDYHPYHLNELLPNAWKID